MTILLILGIAHVLGDYLCQPECLAKKKTEKFKWLLLHAGIYGLIMLGAVFFCAKGGQALWGWLILAFSHFIIDFLRAYVAEKKWKKPMGRLNIFCMDQLLHVVAIVGVWYFLLQTNETALLTDHKNMSGFWPVLVCSALTCVIWDPAAVLIRKVFDLFQPASNTSQETKKAGRTPAVRSGEQIGKLERLIISVLVLCGQFGAIGFVLTAKSVARFKQIETDRDFAERYLVGTLVSAVIALLAGLAAKALL